MQRVALFASLAALLAALMLWLWGENTPRRAELRQGRKPGATGSAEVDAAGGRRTGGVGRRTDVDRSGEGVVRGRVVDGDGTAVSEGRVILHCLAPGAESSAPIADGAVGLSPEGEFSGPGCRGIVCAELRHATLVPRDPWVLEVNQSAALLVAQALERRVGLVLDSEGQAVAGAQVLIRPGSESEDDPAALPPFTSRSTVSDGEGFFSFARVERAPCDPCGEASGRCEPGERWEVPTYASLTLVARAPGFRTTEKEVSVDDEDGWQIALLRPLEPMQGTLTDADGQEYARARVLARAHARAYEVHHARVRAGAFEFDELGEGTYDLRAIQDGVELVTSRGHVAGEAVRLVGAVPAEGQTVVVEVVRRGTDTPIEGATVDGGPFTRAQTNADGTVQATSVLPGTYKLGVRVPGLGPQGGVLTVPAEGEQARIERVEVEVRR